MTTLRNAPLVRDEGPRLRHLSHHWPQWRYGKRTYVIACCERCSADPDSFAALLLCVEVR